MNMSKHLDLPIQLERIRSQLEPSLLDSVRINPSLSSSSLHDSKFSGLPYLPLNHAYPKDIEGNVMYFLAQINFAQLRLDPPFPNSGILQFFISPILFHNKIDVDEHIFQHYFKVRYYSKILSEGMLVQSFPLMNIFSTDFPILSEMKLSFTHKLEPVSAMDYRIEKFLTKPLSDFSFELEDGRSLEDVYIQHFLGAEHKVGGYPYFLQIDTRKNSPFLRRFDTLLLQIVSNDEQNIMWGDSGVIKFFINQQKLINLDFSEIYFVTEQYV